MVLLFCITGALATIGVDLSQECTNFQCLYNQGFRFAVIRVYSLFLLFFLLFLFSFFSSFFTLHSPYFHSISVSFFIWFYPYGLVHCFLSLFSFVFPTLFESFFTLFIGFFINKLLIGLDEHWSTRPRRPPHSLQCLVWWHGTCWCLYHQNKKKKEGKRRKKESLLEWNLKERKISSHASVVVTQLAKFKGLWPISTASTTNTEWCGMYFIIFIIIFTFFFTFFHHHLVCLVVCRLCYFFEIFIIIILVSFFNNDGQVWHWGTWNILGIRSRS